MSPTPAGLRGGGGDREGPAGGRQVCFRPASARSGWNESFRWGYPARAAAPSLPEPAPSGARPRPGPGRDQAERWSRRRERRENPGPGSQAGRRAPGAFSAPGLTSDPVWPQEHPNRAFWKRFLSESANQSSGPTLLLYLGRLRHKQIVPS